MILKVAIGVHGDWKYYDQAREVSVGIPFGLAPEIPLTRAKQQADEDVDEVTIHDLSQGEDRLRDVEFTDRLSGEIIRVVYAHSAYLLDNSGQTIENISVNCDTL